MLKKLLVYSSKILMSLLLVFITFGFMEPRMNMALQKPVPTRARKIVIVVKPFFGIEKNNFGEFIKHYTLNHKGITPGIRKRITEVIFKHSDEYIIDPIVILAVQGVESSYRYWVKGALKEKGLGQILEKVWLNEDNKDNLYAAGIIRKGKEYRLKWIGKNTESTAHILSIKRKMCQRWYEKGTLRTRGYKTVDECMIRRYNGTGNQEYYQKVTSIIGQYYLFVRTLKEKERLLARS